MAIATLIIPLLIQYGPQAVTAIIGLWRKEAPDNVQLQEWETLLATLNKSYDDYIAAAKIK